MARNMAASDYQEMQREEIVAICCSIIISTIMKRRARRRRNRKTWVKQWILNRPQQGAYNNLIAELRLCDTASYANFLRMDPNTFEELLNLVGPSITKKDTRMRRAIPAGERLALTLRFLATGESYKSLQYLYRVPSQTIGQIVPQVCSAITIKLKDYMKVPNTQKQWQAIAAEFEEKWNFNNCLGAMDGKHVVVRAPPCSGSYYFNYKHTFSIVLLALVDADYKFTYVDVGTNGRISDGGVFKNSNLAQALENGDLNIPEPTSLPNRNTKMPYVIVADDAFPLSTNIMKPYSLRGMTAQQRVFNYRLSRARRIVENAFGILANRFRIFMTPIALCTENVEKVVMAACSLHNFLRSKSKARNIYTPIGFADIEDLNTHEVLPGQWRQQPSPEGLVSLARQGSNRCPNSAKEIREEFCSYFNSIDGQVDWQWDKV